jgi:hypothetical protein
MEKNIYCKPLKIPSFLGVVFLFYGLALHGLETKRFDAPPPKRPTYLSFAKPTPLRFSISPQPVDRFNIALPASQPIVQTAVVTQVSEDANATATLPVPSLPSQFDQNASSAPVFQSPQMNSSPFLPKLAPPNSLPLSDPFQDLDAFEADSTDELLRILENSDMGASGSSFQASPFVPPYTVAPDGLRMSNKATYKRVRR